MCHTVCKVCIMYECVCDDPAGHHHRLFHAASCRYTSPSPRVSTTGATPQQQHAALQQPRAASSPCTLLPCSLATSKLSSSTPLPRIHTRRITAKSNRWLQIGPTFSSKNETNTRPNRRPLLLPPPPSSLHSFMHALASGCACTALVWGCCCNCSRYSLRQRQERASETAIQLLKAPLPPRVSHQ